MNLFPTRRNNLKICLGVDKSLKNTEWLSVSFTGRPDIKDNAVKLNKIRNESCAMIMASHVLEHLGYKGWGNERVDQTIVILKNWFSKLQNGGVCIVCVPDMDKLIKVYSEFKDSYWQLNNTIYKDIMGPIFGNLGTFDDRHYMLYNFNCLKYCLEKAGFKNIQELSSFDGLPIDSNPAAKHWCSLNVIAEK
jgi:predicted SAM-dependent methyltransferase